MISTTVSGIAVFLLPYAPDWGSKGVKVAFEKTNYRDAGMSNREEREEMAASLHATMEYSGLLLTSEASAMRSSLNSWDNRPIICPFWPAEALYAGGGGAAASVQGALRVWYEPDWSNWEIGTGTGPVGFTPTSVCLTAPILWGRFDTFPERQIENGNDVESADFKLVENGPVAYALDIHGQTLTMGATVNAASIPKLTVPFTWGNNKANIDVRIKREKVGYGRDDADTYYAQAARPLNTLNFAAMNAADTTYLLALFKDRSGSVSPWWAVSPESTTVQVFGRFFADKIEIVWDKPARAGELASCQMQFVGLPSEQYLPSGETFGTTIGPKPKRWFGYSITDGASTWRFTSYEGTITGPGGVYTHQSINHGRITEEINLQVSDCVLDMQHWLGNPFGRLLSAPTADPLSVTIYEGLISNPTAAEAIFTGDASMPDISGPRLKITLKGAGSKLLTIQGPRQIAQETCCAILGDSRCKVDLSTVTTTQTLTSYAAGVAVFSVAASTWDAHHFQYGHATRTVGGVVNRFQIADSYADGTTGNLTLILTGLMNPPVTGSESGWVLVAGCDGTRAICKNRFNNLVNIRAVPDLPDTNPTMVLAPQSTTGSKK